MKGGDAATIQHLLFKPQQVTPFQRPEIRELRSLQQLIDQLGAFVGGDILDEGCGFAGRWNRAGQVEEGPPDKGRVIAEFGWQEAQFAPFCVESRVDEIGRGRRVPGEAGPVRDEGELDRGLKAEVADVHRGFARSKACDKACRIDLNIQAGGLEDRPAIHVAFRAVGEARRHLDRNLLFGREGDALGGCRLKSRDVGLIRFWRRRAGCDPLAENPRGFRIRIETRAAFVWDGQGCLAQQETLLRIVGVHEGLQERRMILCGVLSAQRKRQSAFACLGSVAGTEIAPGTRKNGHDVVPKRKLRAVRRPGLRAACFGPKNQYG